MSSEHIIEKITIRDNRLLIVFFNNEMTGCYINERKIKNIQSNNNPYFKKFNINNISFNYNKHDKNEIESIDIQYNDSRIENQK